MEFNLDLDKVEAKTGVGEPIPSGEYLFVVTELADFRANSGTQGVNTVMKAVGVKDDVDGIDVKAHHGKQARPTFFITEKTAGMWLGWMQALGMPYTGKGANLADGIGKVFWGRIRSYYNEDGFPHQDMLSFSKASDDDKKLAAKFVAEWTGEDRPPADVGGGVKVASKSDEADDEDDEATPF